MNMRMMPALAGLAILLPAVAWAAWTPTAPALATLAKGKAWMEVQSDPQGAMAQVHGVVDIAAPPSVVWASVMDCAQAVKMTPSLKSCRVVDRDPKGRWMVREDITHAAPLPDMRVVFRSELDAPRGFTFRKIEGDMNIMEGGWRFEPLDGGTRTRAVYWSRISPGLPIPGPLMRSVVRSEAPKALTGLKAVAEASAREKASKQ